MDGANIIAAGALIAIGLGTMALALLEQRRGRIRRDYEVKRWRRRS